MTFIIYIILFLLQNLIKWNKTTNYYKFDSDIDEQKDNYFEDIE